MKDISFVSDKVHSVPTIEIPNNTPYIPKAPPFSEPDQVDDEGDRWMKEEVGG